MNEEIVDYVEIFSGKNGLWYFHGKANNGEIVVASEGYTRKDTAKKMAEGLFPAAEQKEVEGE